jgi:hypothetical protein
MKLSKKEFIKFIITEAVLFLFISSFAISLLYFFIKIV